jgi:hypothetical protein
MSADSSTHDARIAPDGEGGAVLALEHEGGTIRAWRVAPKGLVPALVSLVDAEVDGDHVRLTWYVAGAASFSATVERRREVGDWEPVASVFADGTGRLLYEDRAVTAGARYAYRLVYQDGARWVASVETWVTVPALRFALLGIAPNPSAGDPEVSFALASAEPGTLDVFDAAGRRVASREVGALGSGTHAIRFGREARLPVGVYTVRLRQGGLGATRRAVVVR